MPCLCVIIIVCEGRKVSQSGMGDEGRSLFTNTLHKSGLQMPLEFVLPPHISTSSWG